MTREHVARSGIDFGYTAVRLRIGRRGSIRVGRRSVLVCASLLAIALVAAVAALGLGDYPLSSGEVFAALTGRGSEFERLLVLEWRLPMALAAVVFGALLGVGGAVFQSLTRNPLGSPDVIGFDAGAYTAVAVTTLFLGANRHWMLSLAALAGGLAAACVVYLLARKGGVQGFRLIIVGIAVSAMLGAVNSYLITRAEISDAKSIGFWSAGSLARVDWAALVPALAGAILVAGAMLLLGPSLRQLELGDDAALALGVRPTRARPALLLVGVAATALVTAAAGPIGFVALAAPQLARRLTGSPGVSAGSAACMGAVLLSAAHLASLGIAQLYRPIPVGILTVCLGGMYLIWLLIRESRRSV